MTMRLLRDKAEEHKQPTRGMRETQPERRAFVFIHVRSIRVSNDQSERSRPPILTRICPTRIRALASCLTYLPSQSCFTGTTAPR